MMAVLRRCISALVPKACYPQALVARHIIRTTRGTVTNGPFKGLTLVEPSWNAHAAKMIGVYEREIYSCLEVVRQGEGWTVINIGAADGYYAVGMAMWQAVSKVIAFEMDANSRRLLGENARRNKVADKVVVEGACTPEKFEALLRTTARDVFVFCDVEGYEKVLLDPVLHRSLARCQILVEVHDVIEPGVGAILRDRFANTHAIHRIDPEPRKRAEFMMETKWTSLLKDFFIESAIGDQRPGGIYWLMMTTGADRERNR